MSGWTNGHPPGGDLAHRVQHMQDQRSWRRRVRRWATALCLAVMLVVGVDGLVPAGFGIVFAAPPAPPKPPAVQGTPNRGDPRARASSATRASGTAGGATGAAANAAAGPPSHIQRTLPALMQPGSLPLKAGAAAAFNGSDGVLEVQVPANAVTAADVTAAGGGLSLRITQIAPASGSSAGGSGMVSFGTYLIQVVDAQGILAPHGLRAPVTLKLHPFGASAKRNSALDLSKAFVVLNGSLPEGTQLAPIAPAAAGPAAPGHMAPDITAPSVGLAPVTPALTDRAAIGLGALASQPVTLDTTTNTLIAPLTVGTPSTSLSWNTHAPVASFGNPDPFNVDLNAGGLTASIPIDVPAGPGGTTPPISLSYGSAGVAEQHAPQGAAGWTGEGWNLGLGAITWAEHNVLSNCSPNCTCGGGAPCSPNWQSVWQISDPFGTGSELIAPDINYSTYYDDTPNNYCTTVVSGSCTAYANWPVQWHTADENYVKVISYVGPLTLTNMAPKPPCFRVWLRNGIMEEFGCTSDSLQYYFEPGNGYHITGWMLDLITDSEGNQIHLVYQATTGTKTDTDVNHTVYTYKRDVVLQRIEYDSPGCRDPQNMCTGTGWTPLAQVVFNAAHTPTSFYPGPAPTGCNTGTNMRCDDPLDLSGSSGLAAPDVQSLYVLNSVQVQTRSSGTGAWNTLKTYQLSYDQSGPTTVVDPATGKNESTAGKLLLTKIVELGDDGTTAMPTRTFSYTSVTEYYEDDVYHPNPAGNCGPAFNVRTGCLLWSQSYAGNSYYLSSADNGMGLHQTFSWANARNNTHGVNGGGTNNAVPLYCNGLSAAAQATYPCNEADDQNWSRVVLTDQHEQHYRAASTGNVLVDSHTGYAYQLSYPLAAQECSDCVAGFNWGNQNDGDYLDYYHGKFMGFAQATVNQPDGGQEVHKYYATMGYGLYNMAKVTCFSASPCHAAPWWDIRNAGHGHETEVDVYDAPPNASRLLRQTLTQYTLTCPPPGVTATPAYTAWGDWDLHRVSMLDHNNPVAVCRVLPSQVDSYVLDGAAQASSPHTTTTSAYDTLNRVTDETTNSNGGGSATGSPTVIVTHTDYIQDDAITTSLTSASGRYLIDFPAQVYTRDSGNTVHYSCSQTSYDGAAYATGQQSTLTLGHATTSDSYTNCGTAPSFTLSGQLRTTSVYDAWGNALASNDADANAGVAGHTGCTYNSAQYTSCSALDATYETLPVSDTNALNQASTTGYTASAAGGFGLWPTSTTDFNGQVTSYGYDALGRMTSTTLPGETAGLTTTTWSYTDFCAPTEAQAPCVEIDETQRLDATTTVVSRAFYDGLGRLVETRRPGPSGQDVVAYAWYDETGDLYKESNSYFVPTYTGAPGLNAFSSPDPSQPGTIKSRDVLDRVLTVTDPASNVTTMRYTAACNVLTGDTGCYEQTTVVDALGHQRVSSNDALGRQAYDQRFTGNSTATYAVYATTKYQYDANGKLIQITHPDGTTTTGFSFDAAGRKTGQTDPDRGTEAYSYDPNGNITQIADARGAAGTVYAGYDGLDRLLWRNTSNTPVGARVAYAYDGAAGGSTGIGKLTSETFTGGAGSPLSGTYRYSFDIRGRATRSTTTLGGVGVCPTGWTCADIGAPAIAGSQSYVGDGVWTVQGAGGDIWGTSDQFHYVYQSQPGDGSVSAQIAGQSPANTSTWAKAGVMLRLSNDPGAPYYAVEVTPGNGIVVQDRTTQGGSAAWPATASGMPNKAPAYVQVTRTGTSFTAYTSSDGTTWTAITGSTVSIPALTGTLLAGIAVTAHNTGALSTVTVGSVSPAPPVPSSVTSYSVAKTYDDAQDVLSQTYPTGEVVNNTFTGQGWQGQVTTTQGTTTTTLASNVAYSGNPGAAGKITGMQLGNGVYNYAASYDFAHRLTSLSLARASDGTVLYQTQPGYDGVGNVTSVLTTLPAGTDNQAFCYDEQDRLIWAGSTGTPACGSTLTPGSLTAAQYTQTFGYDVLGRLTSGPLGPYTYGDSAHKHAATSIGTSYTASYDAAGDMTCRAPDASTTCAGGSPTGQQLTFDAEGSLTAWQNAPTAPTTTAQYLYDGDGLRVAQQVATSGTTTTTAYIGTIEEVASSGATTTTTTYYYAADVRVALAVNGTFSYLGDDALGSASVALDAAGALQASQLYAPYGGQRYATGTMPGSFGFTGQRADGATGLDYYISRYYDPVAGQFTSADTTLALSGYDPWGLSRYAYVAGNPVSKTDPDGHCFPICTMIAGAVIGGLIGAGVSIATQAAAGHCCDVKKVVAEAAIGAVSGAITGALGPVGGAATTILTHAVVGGLVGAASQAASNLVEGKPLGDGVLLAAGVGLVTGGISGGVAARQAAKVGGALSAKGLLPSAMRRISKSILQRVTNRASEEIGANAANAARYLSAAEYAAGRRGFGGMVRFYGVAVERNVARRVARSRILDSLFEHAGNARPGQRLADFYGRGLFKGGIYDITTVAQAGTKAGKYGEFTMAVTYRRPAGLWRFP